MPRGSGKNCPSPIQMVLYAYCMYGSALGGWHNINCKSMWTSMGYEVLSIFACGLWGENSVKLNINTYRAIIYIFKI